MMTGIVTVDREAILRLTVQDANGQAHAYDAVIDTGYTGNLTLPPSFIAALGLQWYRFDRATLADGSQRTYNVYKGVVLWDGQPRTITIDEMDATPLVGMWLMYGYELVLPVLNGATFTLRKIVTP